MTALSSKLRRPRAIVFSIALAIAAQLGVPAARIDQNPDDSSRKPAAEVQTLIDAGRAARRSPVPNLGEAERQLSDALAAARRLRDVKGESKALLELADLAISRSKRDEAELYCKQSIDLCHGNRDTEGEADSLFAMAILFRSSNPERAAVILKQAVSLFRAIGIDNKELHALSVIGSVYANADRADDSIEAYDEMIRAAKAIGDERAEADGHCFRASVLWHSRPPADTSAAAEVRSELDQTSAIYHKLNDLENEIRSARLLAWFEFGSGRSAEAQSQFESALILSRTLNKPKVTVDLLSDLGDTAETRGDRFGAIRYACETVQVERRAGNHEAESRALRRLGDRFAEAGLFKNALSCVKAAPVRSLVHANPQDTILNTMEIANHSALTGNEAAEFIYLARAGNQIRIELADSGSRRNRIVNLGLLAEVYRQTGDLGHARETLHMLVSEVLLAGQSRLLPATLRRLGQVEFAAGEVDAAGTSLQAAVVSSQAQHDPFEQGQTLGELSSIEKTQNRLPAAEQHLLSAIRIFERVGKPVARSQRFRFDRSADMELSDLYRNYMHLLLMEGRPVDAFLVCEKLKMNELREALERDRIQVGGPLTADERSLERRLIARLDLLNFEMDGRGDVCEPELGNRTERIAGELSDAQADLQRFRVGLFARYPAVARLRAIIPLTLKDVSELIPEDAALLEFAEVRSEHAARIVLFVVTRSKGALTITARVLSAPSAELVSLVNLTAAACSDPNGAFRQPSSGLYSAILRPAESRIAGRKRLIICPDGFLWRAPFAALIAKTSSISGRVDDQFLTDRYEISYAFCIAEMATLTAHRENALSHPPIDSIPLASVPTTGYNRRSTSGLLIGSREWVDAALHDFDTDGTMRSKPDRPPTQLFSPSLPGTKELRGTAAKESSVKGDYADFQYLHFASPVHLNDAAPFYSAIRLAASDKSSADNGLLTAREICELRLSADFTVLSESDTSLNALATGKGLCGLSAAFRIAGCPSLIAAQWQTDGSAGAAITKEIIGNLVTRRLRKGEALRLASLAVRKSVNSRSKSEVAVKADNRDLTHPYYWAPFILLGDWR